LHRKGFVRQTVVVVVVVVVVAAAFDHPAAGEPPLVDSE
jgi:hypothetical protein